MNPSIMNSHKVSVIMPAYNAQDFIKQSILSVINQTYTNIELVIVNDGSTDNTADVIMDCEKMYPDKILFVNKSINEGTAKTINIAMEYASGEYLSWLSADDLYSEKMVESSVDFLLKHPEFDACYSLSAVIDEKNNILGFEKRSEEYINTMLSGDSTPLYKRMIEISNFFHGCSVLGKRTNFLEVGGFDPAFRYAHDYDFWLRFAAITNIGFINEYNVYGRTYPTQISRQGHNEKDAVLVWSNFKDNKQLYEKLMKKAGHKDYIESVHLGFINRISYYHHNKEELLTVLNEYKKFIETLSI